MLDREDQTPKDRTEQEGPRRRAHTRAGDSGHQASLSGSPEPSLAPDQYTMGAHEGGPLEGNRLKDSPPSPVWQHGGVTGWVMGYWVRRAAP